MTINYLLAIIAVVIVILIGIVFVSKANFRGFGKRWTFNEECDGELVNAEFKEGTQIELLCLLGGSFYALGTNYEKYKFTIKNPNDFDCEYSIALFTKDNKRLEHLGEATVEIEAGKTGSIVIRDKKVERVMTSCFTVGYDWGNLDHIIIYGGYKPLYNCTGKKNLKCKRIPSS